MLIELHSHTSEHSSCGRVKAADLLHFVVSQGVHGVVLTDHHYLWSDEELASLRKESGIPDDFLLFSGQEVTTADVGDVLVYGATEVIHQSILLNELRNKYPEAALVWAHPYRGNRRPTSIELFNAAFDAIEIVNPHQWKSGNEAGISDWQDWGFVASGGSDIHSADPPGFYPTEFSADISSMAALVSAIKDGHCRPVLAHPYHIHKQEEFANLIEK